MVGAITSLNDGVFHLKRAISSLLPTKIKAKVSNHFAVITFPGSIPQWTKFCTVCSSSLIPLI